MGAGRLAGAAVVLVRPRAGGVHQHLRPHRLLPPGDEVAGAHVPQPVLALAAQRLDVVRRHAPAVERAADEGPHEARVVVVQVGVGVLEAAVGVVELHHRLLPPHRLEGEPAGPPGEERPDEPVEERPEEQLHERVPEALRVLRVEADLLHRRGVRGDEAVSGAAQLAHEPELEALEVLDPAPGEVARLLAGAAREVGLVDEGHPGAARREGRRAHGPVDAAADHQHVVDAFGELVNVRLAEPRHVFLHCLTRVSGTASSTPRRWGGRGARRRR